MTFMINGGEAIYRVLRANGVKTVFGLLGGSMLELYDAMYEGGEIAYVGARDERAAGHMADAYARVTGGSWRCFGRAGRARRRQSCDSRGRGGISLCAPGGHRGCNQPQ